jgi:hypothetical protein
MSLDYIRRTRQILNSEVLAREIFIDEIADLSDSDLNRLIVETEITTKGLQEDQDSLDAEDPNRIHVRHKRGIWKGYKQAALIEKGLRNIDTGERFFQLVSKRIGAKEAEALMAAARG